MVEYARGGRIDGNPPPAGPIYAPGSVEAQQAGQPVPAPAPQPVPPPHDAVLEARVARLEEDVRSLREALGRALQEAAQRALGG